jgi:hypothetical protein
LIGAAFGIHICQRRFHFAQGPEPCGVILGERTLLIGLGQCDAGLDAGRRGITVASRSCTIWRVRTGLAARSITSTTDDRPSTDLERRVARPGTPFTAVSMGTVTSASTSSVASPGRHDPNARSKAPRQHGSPAYDAGNFHPPPFILARRGFDIDPFAAVDVGQNRGGGHMCAHP